MRSGAGTVCSFSADFNSQSQFCNNSELLPVRNVQTEPDRCGLEGSWSTEKGIALITGHWSEDRSHPGSLHTELEAAHICRCILASLHPS